jgi:Fe-S oxidoreductase
VDWVLILGLLINAIALPIAARRVVWLYRLITSGQPDPGRVAGVTGRIGHALKNQVVEVFAQQKLLKWTVPGAAHFFVFWAFVILGSVYVEAYGVLLIADDFAIPLIGHWEVLGFAQDLIAILAVVSLVVFAQIRLKNAPEKLGRKSRFKGSHLGGAWLVLFMIFNVIWTMFLFRAAASASGHLPYDTGAFASVGLGNLMDGLSEDTLHVIEGIGLLLHIGIMLVFLVIVLNSKHLHIFVAPLNVLFKREPIALGAVKPLTNAGKPVTLDDIEDMDEDTTLGIGTIEDFSWKGLLDMATCTECGRCQSQCPAWNTEKPLSPKMLIMNLRDHAFHIGSYLQADHAKREKLLEDDPELAAEVERALVGATEGEAWHPTGGGIIDPDVLWSCVTCGACVQQCPVDIEHVDHIVDMRRYQVLVENNFPAELNQLFKGMESKGNPWNLSPNMRTDWTQGLDFEVPIVGEDLESLESVDWLFWVGCAGAYEDRAKKTTRAVAELLNIAGVSFGVLGKGETCTGDSARRAGNEFVFQGLAQQNVETFKEFKVKKVVSTCAHCFNTLKNEYKEFGIELEVVHHTQLLNRLVREGKLTPVKDGAGAAKRSITYHDPCYIGRHNQVYEPPRELLQVLPGAEVVEMERNSERSFCCGAGGARMWMEETIGERINLNRTTEAVGTGADQIAVGCPFCRVMLSDGLTAMQDSGDAREEVEVLDVAQMLLASVKGEPATRQKKAAASSATASAAAGGTDTLVREEETAAEPEAGDATQTEGTITETADAGPAAKASGGSSLFDLGDSADEPEPATTAEEKSVPEEAKATGSLFDLGPEAPEDKAEKHEARVENVAQAMDDDLSSGGSLFDVGGSAPADDTPETPAEPKTSSVEPEITSGGSLFDLGAPAEPEASEPAASEPAASEPAAPEPSSEIPSGGSLFDLEAPAEPAAPEPAAPEPAAPEPAAPEPAAPEPASEPTATPVAEPSAEIPSGGSLFDIAAPEPAPSEPTASEPIPSEPGTSEPATDAPGTTADDGKPDPAALSQAATAASSGDEAPEPAPAEAEAQVEETGEAVEAVEADQPETQPEPEPKPAASSGEAHSPKTDVDINEKGSLFDL